MASSAILIRSDALDFHAHAVHWGLSEVGQNAAFWPTGLYPANQSITCELNCSGDNRNIVSHANGGLSLDGYAVVWNRRPGQASLGTLLHPDDHDFVKRECHGFMSGLTRVMSPDALWINSPDLADLDIAKHLQLATAVRAGLAIPPTLISNDPKEIRAFYEKSNGRMIYKNFATGLWTEDRDQQGSTAIGYTALVTPEALANESALKSGPGLYQALVEKSYELRVTVFGRTLIAAKILSGASKNAQLDWRSDYGSLTVEPAEVPLALEETILRYMEISGLLFGCFDILITPQGGAVFLEVNQAGQFLWLEDRCSELPLLDCMCRFLASADRHFIYKTNQPALHYSAFSKSRPAQALRARREALRQANQAQTASSSSAGL